ncbi:MAG TPA: hypothetical protein VGL88_03020 [Pseudonocardiaceae bacterium]
MRVSDIFAIGYGDRDGGREHHEKDHDGHRWYRRRQWHRWWDDRNHRWCWGW